MKFIEWLDRYYNITKPGLLTEEKTEELENKYEDDCIIYGWSVQY